MESFLSASRAAVLNLSAYKRIRIVRGNETCDLDSAVSTLIQAFSEYLDGIESKETDLATIPLMNIPKREYRVKTEVVFFFELHNIPSDLLIFRDEIDLKALMENTKIKLEVVLVDHHNLSDEDMYLMDSVVKIIDHRPRDERWSWPGREIHLESVGSCATLVARNLFDKHPQIIDSQISSLLRGPILIDTCNFAKEANRATVVDVEVTNALEKAGSLSLDRDKVFNEIVEAKSDISKLTTDDLLIRDLKITNGIPIVGLPMLVKDFLDLQESRLEGLGNFAKCRNTTLVILIGLKLDSQKVSRDIAIFSLGIDRLREKITNALTASTQPCLELNFIRKIHQENGDFILLLYEQKNLCVTRKQILPIIRHVVSLECQCIFPLGMEEGKIPDDAITASSSYETKSVGPQNARIRQEKNGGAWCPKAQISSAIREYLEIDLTRNHLIAWTETQGRFGNGQGQEYAEAFFLEYWRDTKWHQYKNLMGITRQQQYLLGGEAEVGLAVCREQSAICTLQPTSPDEYVASYSAPKGSSLGPGGRSVRDSSYDGSELESLLVNGLGQLTDGILGEISEILTSSINDTNWTFSMMRVWFSIDGENYRPEIEKSEWPIDVSSAAAETVLISIPLESKIGQFVKVEFSLAAKWLLLSEITFYTGSRSKLDDLIILADDRSSEVEQNRSESRTRSSNSVDLTINSAKGINITDRYEIDEDALTPDAFPVGISQTYIGLVSGVLTVFVLFLTCTAFLFKQRGRNKVALLQKHTALLCDSSAPGIAISPKDVKLSNSIVTGLSLIRKPILIAPADNLPDRSNTNFQTDSKTAIVDSRLDDSDTCRSTLYERTYNLFSEENLVLCPKSNASSTCTAESCSDFKRKSNFATNKYTEISMPTSTTYSTKKAFHLQSRNTNHQRIYEGYYAATDILTIKKREIPSTQSPFTPLQIREKTVCLPSGIDSYNIQRVSRHRLRILDKLGEGNFGLIHLCEAKGIMNPEVEATQNRQTVIVRSLWRGVVDSLRLDFTKDMHVLAMLRDSNVAKMIALVEEEPFGAVFEYGQFGDLPSFLENHGSGDLVNKIDISYNNYLSFITQIASGMKYLESMNIAHCDLAARNCIVSQDLSIKVSDHAIYCNKYDHHYFIDGHNVKIPLRWMAWEAVLLGKRSCRADVWSFATTVWEIFLNCKEIPYADLTVAQVLENCGHCYRSETYCADDNRRYDDNDDEKSQRRISSRPDHCPDDLYNVMKKCWSTRIEDRPNFEEIHQYLKRLAHD
ncbi:Epithelial discoidin domain-containing receptor 1 [Melipona quadrifasciata]|uniref:Epithelial discoidin domain-containing receptor 1 n=1 Tax=Melipona quadrifasciata TaxID=166423 RepID=A0A0M9A9A8_9HYME|nr:Epithelial discoidin domain-containing receptor 1 [Melipona quadrifasciata]